MSDISESLGSQSSQEDFQSAQRPQDEIAVDDEDLDIASIHSHRSTSPDSVLDQKQALRDAECAVRAKAREDARDTKHEVAQEVLDYGNEVDTVASGTLTSRPNKYRGPASTWRNWTAPERELAASLDQLTAKNLSVHLYNVFKLKQIQAAGRRAQRSEEYGDGIGLLDADDWAPPRVWTAWPMPPQMVPRQEEEKNWAEVIALSSPYISKPRLAGDVLRELLEAQVLRKARSNFMIREWDTVNKDAEEATDLKPVVMADDQRASVILRPTIQHLLSKLDELLMGLHNARSACLALDDSGSESRSRTRGRPASRSHKRKRQRVISKDETDCVRISEQVTSRSGSENTIASKGKPRSRSRPKRPRSISQNSFYRRNTRLSPRDWSDVLGVASLTGWDFAVVEKAASRCGHLFNEGVTFRTLEEGRHEHTETRCPVLESAPVFAAKGAKASSKDNSDMSGGVHVDGYLEPIEGKKSWRYQNKKNRRRCGRTQLNS